MTLEMSPHPLASSALQGRMRARGEAPATPRPLLPTCRRAEGARGKFAGRLGGELVGWCDYPTGGVAFAGPGVLRCRGSRPNVKVAAIAAAAA